MNMGGIGAGFGIPQRMNQIPPQPFMGGNQPMVMNPGFGMNPPGFGNIPKMMHPQTNPNFSRPV